MQSQLIEVVKTVLRVVIGTLLAAFLADMANLSSFAWADWKPVIFSVISAAVVVILNALNWTDPRYGLGTGTPE